MYCHYFVFPQRVEDRVLEVLVRKTETIKKELGSLSKVIDDHIERRLGQGIRRRDAEQLAREIERADLDAEKRSIAIKAQKKQGAPTALNLETLLAEPAAKREKWIQDRADRKLADSVKKAVVAAASVEDLHAALLPVSDLPAILCQRARWCSSRARSAATRALTTPRTLTKPIVSTPLEPILARLRGEGGRPAQILDLKVCDPAMGSGAFLVQACRNRPRDTSGGGDQKKALTTSPTPLARILIRSEEEMAGRSPSRRRDRAGSMRRSTILSPRTSRRHSRDNMTISWR